MPSIPKYATKAHAKHNNYIDEYLLVVSSTEWFRLTYKWLTFTFMQTRNTQ